MPEIKDIFQTMEYGLAPESDKEAKAWLESHNQEFGLFIAGRWQKPKGAKKFNSINPANKKTLARITQASSKDVDVAVRAAKTALPKWRALSGHARARYLYALARLVQKYARLLAVVETLDNGKPIRESRDIDLPLVARHFYHHAGWAQLLATEFPDRQAAGVVGAIVPWNFPLLMLAWKIAPALAAGCTVVLKPAEYTPLSALLFAELAMQAGLPAGVLNIVTGDGETGRALVNHTGIDKIAFTGSTEVGKYIRKATAGSGKKLSLELGGKSPFVVFDDSDLDAAIEGVVDSIWFNQGEVCCAGSRILVQESVEQKFIAKLRTRMEKLRVGNPLEKNIDIGALASQEQLTKIEKMVAQGIEQGGTLWQPTTRCPQDGFYYPPSLFSNVTPANIIAREEIFGPVVAVISFRTPEEAVALANNSVYGLASSIWTENINLALDIAAKIKAGVVWINCSNQFDAAAGFGGVRESGFGREGGREGMEEYLKQVLPTQKNVPKNVPSTARPKKTKLKTHEQQPGIDRTPKLFIGGKQTRPDGGYSRDIYSQAGNLLGQAGEGNRKDLRNAVEAANAASTWARTNAHNRAQILYYLAENLAARQQDFIDRLCSFSANKKIAKQETELSIQRLFTYAAWADKFDGAVHNIPIRGLALAVHEAIGTLGIICPNHAPLLGFVSMVAPAIAMGNTVVVVPSETMPLAATDFYSLLETSDVPAGVVNIVTGPHDELAKTLSEHLDVDALWYAGQDIKMVESASAGNLKRTFCPHNWDWFSPFSEGRSFLHQACQVKNIWVPYGE